MGSKRKMPHFSSEQFQSIPSSPCNPSLRNIFITYMKYRKTTADTSKYPLRFVKILHNSFCKNGMCKCDCTIAAFNHVENCQNSECTACKPIQSSLLASGLKKAVDLKNSSSFEFSSCERSDITEYYQHGSKRIKVGTLETPSFQLSPKAEALYIHDETPSTKDISITRDIEMDQEKQATKTDPKIKGMQILDFFTANELQEHLSSLRMSSDLDTEGSKTIDPCDENTCNLCGSKNLKFAPKPIYCLTCTGRIKEGVQYYSTFDEKASKSCVCARCFNHGGKIISKSKFQKEKNDLGDEEPWVQCDECRGWQHQICALYNDKNDLGGDTEYVCPKCYLVRINSGEHVPLQNFPTFGAKNLPTTKLSDYIEKRLIGRLNRDRKERAQAEEKSLDEVPGATDLVVRVVVSANKLLKVNEQFLQIFRGVGYPSEFPYSSKVILLFQKIEGVDICIFAMYVQEYGSECGRPNQRSVYISHIDSVKHFRPNIRSASGEALRTFAYHEMLIGYLDYCKKRGFATAYIWSCPPLKGDDYVFYCHPKIQKTPKPDNLRQWYKSMLKKAAKENIVVGFTNLYDHYFVPNEESNIKVSAARLPYFDGDYWSGAAIGMINKLEKESLGKFKKPKEIVSRRTLRAFGHKDLSEDAVKDILLMQQLGEIILPSKDDFIMVHLQATCTNCHEPIVSQTKWLCKKCKNFLLCSKCNKNLTNTHTSWSGEKHSIYQARVSAEVSKDIEDDDIILTTILFEDKISFLSFCQGNEQRFPYQFDELRRAKHSSMMILYHLHGSIKKSTQDCGEKLEILRRLKL